MQSITIEKPLRKHAKAELKELNSAPLPRNSINPGVAALLIRRGLAVSISLPSPYRTHKGAHIEHLQISDTGRAAVASVLF